MTEEDLNPGRDLRAEARQMLLDAVATAQNTKDRSASIDAIIVPMADWLGGSDRLFGMMDRPVPIRPGSVFLGVSDALAELDATKLSVLHIVAVLGSFCTVQQRVPNYPDFYQRCRAHLEEIIPDAVDRNLHGFEPK